MTTLTFPYTCAVVSPYYRTKLRGLYNTAMQDAQSESEYVTLLPFLTFHTTVITPNKSEFD